MLDELIINSLPLLTDLTLFGGKDSVTLRTACNDWPVYD